MKNFETIARVKPTMASLSIDIQDERAAMAEMSDKLQNLLDRALEDGTVENLLTELMREGFLPVLDDQQANTVWILDPWLGMVRLEWELHYAKVH